VRCCADRCPHALGRFRSRRKAELAARLPLPTRTDGTVPTHTHRPLLHRRGLSGGNVRVGCRTTQPSPGLSLPSVRITAVAVSEHTMPIHAVASGMPADHPSPAPQSQVVSARNMRRIGRRARAPAARAAAMPDASVESKSTPLTTVVCAAPLNATNACSASACAHEPAASAIRLASSTTVRCRVCFATLRCA
jgi:hypothetical protein